MDREYKSELEQVHMTDAGKRSLAKRLSEEEVKPVRGSKRVLRTSLVAAVIVCLLLVTAGAIVLNTPILQQYLGGGAPYDQNVQSLNLSQTVDGYTITITDCVGDDQFLYLGIELAAPEGMVLDPKIGIGDNNETVKYSGFEQGIGSGGGLRRLEDDDPTDNIMRFVWFRWVEKPLAGRDMTITFHNLTRREWVADKVPHEKVVAVKGDWSFGPFKLNFTEKSIELTPNVQIPLLNGKTNVTSVKITPLHVEILLEGGDLAAIHSTGAEKDGCYGLCTKKTTLAIYGKDGKQWELPEPSNSGSWINTEGDRTRVMCNYSQLLDLDDLGSIEVCGVKIPVN